MSQRAVDRLQRNPRPTAARPRTTVRPREASDPGALVAQTRTEASSCWWVMCQPLHLLGEASTRGIREVQHTGLNLFNSPADNGTIVRWLKSARAKNKGPAGWALLHTLETDRLSGPVAAQRLRCFTVPDSGQGPVSELADTLACDAEHRGDLLHGHWLTGLQPVVHQQDLAIPRR